MTHYQRLLNDALLAEGAFDLEDVFAGVSPAPAPATEPASDSAEAPILATDPDEH
ncbi:hypothetical protein [Hymenobacter sp. UV11]|uniref:hypothetical protein n=1 Tax=Hymenobacter sp. UV11 TaxID=1849735 RepID=UPI001414D0AB|nr:hypothetical protein [Hymenobacter sp. UV11]